MGLVDFSDMTASNILLRCGQPSAALAPEGVLLEIVVLHTTTTATLRSLKTAGELAAGLAARIRLLVLEVVPYPLEVESPRVPIEFTQRRFRTVASGARIDTLIDIRLGRELHQVLDCALKPGSVVVLENGAWWTRQRRLARRLTRQGHHVILAS